MKGLDLMKNLTMVELMLVCLTPQLEVDNACQYVKAVCEIVNRTERLTREQRNVVEGFLEECQMWHNTKDNMWLVAALDHLNTYMNA